LNEVRKGLEDPSAASRRIVILGSNAGAMEAVYAIRNDPDLTEVLDEIVLISPGGHLPGGKPCERQAAFRAKHLEMLAEQRDVSAHAILHAAEADAEFGRRSGYTSLDYAGPICRSFTGAFVRLCLEERRRFSRATPPSGMPSGISKALRASTHCPRDSLESSRTRYGRTITVNEPGDRIRDNK
jgi:hypothetical protein